MLFIKKILEKKQESLSLTRLVDQRLAGYQEQRTHKIVHISNLSRSDGFCPREFALLDVTRKKPKGQYVSAALQVAFDNGKALSDLCRNRWLENDVVGDWICPYCESVIAFSKKPKVPCPKCKARLWQYQEVQVVNAENNVVGSLDFLVDFGLPSHIAVECKSMARDIFDNLKAPLAEHRERCHLYLYHMAVTNTKRIDLGRMLVFYVSKGYGVKNEAMGGKVMPFKEFWVERDDKAVKKKYDQATPLAKFRKGGPMPSGICPTSFCGRAKACSVAMECFSGSYPAGV
jgi:hypothetical protein